MGAGVDYATGMHEEVLKRMDTAATNLFNITMMKHKMKQENEIFTLDKKQKELEIKKQEYFSDPEQITMQKNKLDAETKAQTALFNLRAMQLSNEETKNKKELDTYNSGMEMVKNFLSGKSKLGEGQSAKMGPFSISGKQKKGGIDLSSLLNSGSDTPSSNAPKTADDFLSQF